MDYYKLMIPFLLGLIPFIVKLIIDYKSEKEEIKEKYRIKLFERQALIFSELNLILVNLNDSLFNSALFYDTSDEDWPKKSVGKHFTEFVEFIGKNELFIPSNVLSLLNKYHENSALLLSQKLTIAQALPPGKPAFKNRIELQNFFQENSLIFNQIITLLRILIGTDAISEEIFAKLRHPHSKYSVITKSYKFNIDK